MPHAHVHGVHVISGNFTDDAIDLELGLVEPLQVQRHYRSGKKSSKMALMGWEFNHNGYLAEISSADFFRFEFQDERGQRVMFEREFKYDQLYPFKILPNTFSFSKGYMHFPQPGQRAPHPMTMHLIRHKHLEETFVVNGSDDRYFFVKDNSPRKEGTLHQKNRASQRFKFGLYI